MTRGTAEGGLGCSVVVTLMCLSWQPKVIRVTAPTSQATEGPACWLAVPQCPSAPRLYGTPAHVGRFQGVPTAVGLVLVVALPVVPLPWAPEAAAHSLPALRSCSCDCLVLH